MMCVGVAVPILLHCLLPGGSEVNHEKSASLRAVIRTGNLGSTKYKFQQLHHDFR